VEDPANIPKVKLVFSSSIDGDWEIYTMYIDGTELRQLTHNSKTASNTAIDEDPHFSPDGEMITFVSRRDGEDIQKMVNDKDKVIGWVVSNDNAEIYVMDSDGSEQKRLTYNDFEDFSPSFLDNKRIKFFPYSSAAPRINIIDLSTGKVDSLTSLRELPIDEKRIVSIIFGDNQRLNNSIRIGDYAWSPDDKEITFATEIGYRYPHKLYRINADGSSLREICDIAHFKNSISQLKYSPNGKWIAFISGSGISGDLYVLNKGEDIPRNVTAHLTKNGKYEIQNFAFSPDGKKILFILEPKYPGLLKRQSLYLMNSDGTDQRKIAELKIGTDVDFHWEQ
jgi:Tol biopolymer transport system component